MRTHEQLLCVLEAKKKKKKEQIPLFFLSLGCMRRDFCRVRWSVSHHQCREKKRGEAFFKSKAVFVAAVQQGNTRWLEIHGEHQTAGKGFPDGACICYVSITQAQVSTAAPL